MTVEVTLHVTGIDLDDEATADWLANELGDYLWAENSGITTMTVFSDLDPVADAVKAIRCARARGITVIEVKEDTVNVGEITRRVGGVSREAVRKWTHDPSFPSAFDALGGERSSLMWHWGDVVRWLLDTKGIDMDEDLPDRKTVAHINAHIHGIRDVESDAMHLHIHNEPVVGRALPMMTRPAHRVEWEVAVTESQYRREVAVNVG